LDLVGPLFLAAVPLDRMVGKGCREMRERWVMGDGGERKAVVFYPSTTPKKIKSGGKEGRERRRSGEGGCYIWNLEAKG